MMNITAMIKASRFHLALAADCMKEHDFHKRMGLDELAAMAHAHAQRCIARARAAWARVQTALALGDAAVRHTYARAVDGWRGVVLADGATLWTSARTYGKRQSAQRAALRERGRMTIKAENVYLQIDVA